VLTDGDRITNPGIAPPSTPSAARITQTMAEPAAVSSRPASVPPPTANEDAGWSDADSEPQTPPPTNGAAAAPAPVVPTAPALDGAPALSTPVHQAVRVSVEATTETGVFRVTALGAGESAEAGADEALLVLLDPKARLDS
jgi:hypothetical protein